MRAFHGRVLSERRVGDLTLIATAYLANDTICWHHHERPYVSMLLAGCYTEVVGNAPRLARAGAVFLHRAGELHADHFQEYGVTLNVELEDGTPIDEALRALGAAAVRRPQAVRPAWLERVFADFDWIGGEPIAHAAHVAGLHHTHFARAFRRLTGMTPGAYRRERRVELASQLLLESGQSLVRIGGAAGFSDQSHFNNAFRRNSGMAPNQFRRAFAR